mmetsp:Transcript_2231/g.7457  ORF Transcript_2231/g.7457 Transcript_2231/m.7457 type:complete len:200 (-) Transcript_2231:1038-1637(-)
MGWPSSLRHRSSRCCSHLGLTTIVAPPSRFSSWNRSTSPMPSPSSSSWPAEVADFSWPPSSSPSPGFIRELSPSIFSVRNSQILPTSSSGSFSKSSKKSSSRLDSLFAGSSLSHTNSVTGNRKAWYSSSCSCSSASSIIVISSTWLLRMLLRWLFLDAYLLLSFILREPFCSCGARGGSLCGGGGGAVAPDSAAASSSP